MFTLLHSTTLIILLALFYGIAMKIADLLNEHGLKWFTGSAILFGFIWGFFGALLALTDNTMANIILAMNLAFIVRNRLDYLNHQLASSLIIITFLFCSIFNPLIFIIFYSIFVIFGSLKDYLDDVQKKHNGLLPLLSEAMLYYPLPTFIYCLIKGNWIIFWSFLAYTLAYNLVKYFYKKKGYY